MNEILFKQIRNPFLLGSEYEVVKDFSYFKTGESFTYAGLQTIVGDHGRVDRGQLDFYDFSTEDYKPLEFWEGDEDKIREFHDLNFIKTWEWKDIDCIDPVIINGNPASQLYKENTMRLFIPYFKLFVAGDPSTPNWFNWIAQQETALSSVFSRAEFLRFKYCPYSEMISILDEFGVHYSKGKRFKWLEK